MDMATYIMLLNKIRASGKAVSRNLAPDYDPTEAYNDGDYANFDGVLKKFDGTEWHEVNVGEELAELQNDMQRKLDSDQGVENSGKFMIVDENGHLVPYSLNIPEGSIIIDPNLLIQGAAADAKAAGDQIRNKADMDGYYAGTGFGAATAENLIDKKNPGVLREFVFNSTADNASVSDVSLMNVKEIRGNTLIWNQKVGETKGFFEGFTAYRKPVPATTKAANIGSIGGKTVIWNQLVHNTTFANLDYITVVPKTVATVDGGVLHMTKSMSGDMGSCVRLQGSMYNVTHIYYMRAMAKIGDAATDSAFISFTSSTYITDGNYTGAYTRSHDFVLVRAITAPTSNSAYFCCRSGSSASKTDDIDAYFKNVRLVDLTQMFGAGNEPTELTDSRVAEIEAMIALMPDYDTGSLLSAKVVSVVSKDGDAETLDTLVIPAAVRALEGYGQSEVGGDGNVLDLSAGTYTEVGHYVDGVWTVLDTPVVTDVSSMLPDNMLDTEAGGALTFVQANDTQLEVLATVDWLKDTWTEPINPTHKYIFTSNGTKAYISGQSSVIIPSGKNKNLIDLTYMFGSGNEPATVSEFEKLFPLDYYAQNAGMVIGYNGTGIKTVGYNAFNLTTGKAELLGGHQYEIFGVYASLSYSTGESIVPVAGKFTPTKNGILTVTGGDDTTCIHLTWSGYRDGEYEAYWEQMREIPVSAYFPNGMHSIGDVHDSLYPDRAVQRMGYRDYEEGDEDDSSVITDGAHTIYILDTPAITPISPALNFTLRVDDFGTEKTLPVNDDEPITTPLKAMIAYSMDFAREVSTIREHYTPKVENAVSGNFAGLDAEGKTIDSGISAAKFTADLSEVTSRLSHIENVDLELYGEENVIISSVTGKWYKDTSASSCFLPISSDIKTVSITANSSNVAVVAMLQNSIHATNTTPVYATGGSRKVISIGQTETLAIPADCNWICIMKSYDGTDYSPESITFAVDDFNLKLLVSGIKNGYRMETEPEWEAERCVLVEHESVPTGYVDVGTGLVASGFIPVLGANSLYVKMPWVANMSPVIYGACFYDSRRLPISNSGTTTYWGRPNVSSTPLYKYAEIFIPDGAKYWKTTWWPSSLTSLEKFDYYFTKGLPNRITHEVPANRGMENSIRRARQLTDIKWTPLVDIPRFSALNGGTNVEFLDWFYANSEYIGIPYSDAGDDAAWHGGGLAEEWGYKEMFVGLEIDFETFVTASRYAGSILGERTGQTVASADASPYGAVCSALVSYAYGLSMPLQGISNFPTGSRNKKYFRLISDNLATMNLADMRLGDLLHAPGHVILVTDIIRNGSGVVTAIELSEETTIGNGNPTRLGTKLGGVARRWVISEARLKSVYGGYKVYRFNNFTAITYTPSAYVDTGGEGNGAGVIDYPCIPYLGNKARYKTGHIVNSKILIGATGFTTLVVQKDGESYGTYPITGLTEVDVEFSEVGSYKAWLEDSATLNKSMSCSWTVETFVPYE